MATVSITGQNFKDEVINSDKPVLVDFWAIWCGPCQMLAPIVEELSEEHPEIKFAKVNTDQQPMLAQEYGIYSIPTLLLFKDGKIVDKMVGAVPKEQLEVFIAQ